MFAREQVSGVTVTLSRLTRLVVECKTAPDLVSPVAPFADTTRR